MSRTDDHDERLVRLVSNVTGIDCAEARAIGKTTSLSGVGLHAAATKILADNGTRFEDATAAEYAAALERAEADLDYDAGADLIAV